MKFLTVVIVALALLTAVSADKEGHSHEHDHGPHDAHKEELEFLSYDNIDPYHRYARVTSLFEHLHPSHFDSEEGKQKEVTKIKAEMMVLSEKLLKEEHKFIALRKLRDQEKTHLFWFFDADTRHRVERVQLELNDQLRVIENIAEDIEFHWKQLKPLYGLYSKLFLVEVLGFIPDMMSSIVRVFTSSLSMGLLSFLVFGPLAFFLFAFWLSFGMFLLPFVMFSVAIYWMFHLPVVMIEYNPTALQFMSVYIPVLAGFLLLLRYFLQRHFYIKL